MPIFAVTYRYVDDEPRLAALRPARLAWFESLERDGRLLASGQLAGEQMPQGLLALTADDAEHAAAVVDADPFHTAGLITERRIGRWYATVGTATR